MEITKKDPHRNGRDGLRALVLSALLVAMSIVCGKFLAFNLGNVLRISFENLPILLGGMIFGPVWGMAIGLAADLIGCMLVGYAVNPLVTAGAVLIGAVSGLLWRLGDRFSCGARLTMTVGVSHLVGSVLVKSLGLSVFYEMPLLLLMLWRTLNYLIVGIVEGILLRFLIKNKAIDTLIRRYGKEKL